MQSTNERQSTDELPLLLTTTRIKGKADADWPTTSLPVQIMKQDSSSSAIALSSRRTSSDAMPSIGYWLCRVVVSCEASHSSADWLIDEEGVVVATRRTTPTIAR